MVERVGRIARVRADSPCSHDLIEAALVDEVAVRSWLDAANAALITQLRGHTSFVESSVADAARTSLNTAAKTTERADTLDRVAPFAAALDDARVTAAHVDALTLAGKQLDDADQRSELFDRADDLAHVAAAASVDEFRRKLSAVVAAIRRDDGEDRGPVRSGRPEFVAVIDADASDRGGPVVEWAIPVEIPGRVLAELAGTADVHAVVVRNGVVLHAPGNLNLGHSSRLANRDQRRALRGLYRCCAVPGCAVGFDRCKLHHVIWWQQGGRTDLDNLLPACSKHHSNIHHDG